MLALLDANCQVARLGGVKPEIQAAHDAAVAAGEAGYLDPETGLFVLTAAFLAKRGTCCTRGCRHCPYRDAG
jgi:hypothetical protein